MAVLRTLIARVVWSAKLSIAATSYFSSGSLWVAADVSSRAPSESSTSGGLLSTRPCSVAGVPDLQFLDDNQNDLFPIARRRCPNCVNGLYAPRPNGRIDLQPGEAAHFLVGSTAPDYEADPLAVCNVIQTLKLALP